MNPKDHLGELCSHTHRSGSEPIDGVWATNDITITAVKWLSFEESPGDNRTCIFDFTTLSVVGTKEKRIVLPKCRRLISTNPFAVERYTNELLRQFDIHRIEARMDAVIDSHSETYPPSSLCRSTHNHLDNQVAEIQRHCEKTCRTVYHPATSLCSRQKSQSGIGEPKFLTKRNEWFNAKSTIPSYNVARHAS